MDDLKILVTGAGAPGIKGTLYSLKENSDNRKVIVIGVDAKEEVAGKYLCDKFYKISSADDERFIEELVRICEKEKVNALIPCVTAELLKISSKTKIFEEINTKVVVSKPDAIEFANNKHNLMNVAKDLGIPTAKFYLVETFEELLKYGEQVGYPFVVKPPISNGMRGFRIVYKEVDRKQAFYKEKPDSSVITISELYDILGDNFPELMVMEYLPGKEYSVDVLSSEEKVYCVVPRVREVIRSGITFVGSVEKREDIIKYSELLTLKIGLEYAHGMQFKEDSAGVPKIIEANPRVQGTMVMSTLAGANIIYGAVKLALEERLEEFKVDWNARFIRYWGGIGIGERIITI